MNKSVGINIACTGNYHQFVIPLIESLEKFFLPNFHKNYYLYTDNKDFNMSNVQVFWTDLRWPFISLCRYQLIARNKDLFTEDYLIYMDADLKVINYVEEEIFENMPNGIFAVKHLFIDRPTLTGSPAPDIYENYIHSTAYVPPERKKEYCLSGFHGGTRDAFIKKCEGVTKLALTDFYNNGYIAVAHDESYLNRYLIDNPPKTLPPQYCTFEAAPETKLLNGVKIIALQKGIIKNDGTPSYEGVRNLPNNFDFINSSIFWWRECDY